ncbi:MAG TPA: beta-ketoacyl synthase chain length factor [Mucilaginibacter sp.]|jgi:3-oxoacyl-(acyl-carrier-protein) synthase|nr:beta-ketoacyl synthase chain length factor [Mucilaginibacter sp.]
MKAYIRSAACISPQKTFNSEGLLDEIVEYNGTRLSVIEPDYKEYIDPKLARRMSSIIKRGIAAAKKCLEGTGVEIPDAIIAGTALGCLEDTVTFLTRMVELNEEMLPPTAFIQSTHNTVAAQIALMLQCHGYNNTFVHKGISFESALFDALMLLNEKEAHNIIVGGTEEMVDASYKVLSRLGVYRRRPVSNLDLLKFEEKGSMGSEGSVFFLLTDKASNDNLAELTSVKTWYQPENIEQKIIDLLDENELKPSDIDLVITGRNGDIKNDAVYKQLSSSLFRENVLANYKHLCGEYPVSSSFALWLAANIIKRQEVPEIVIERRLKKGSLKKVLIYNHYQNKYHALMLVSAV